MYTYDKKHLVIPTKLFTMHAIVVVVDSEHFLASIYDESLLGRGHHFVDFRMAIFSSFSRFSKKRYRIMISAILSDSGLVA